MSEPLYSTSAAQICNWLSQGALNGIVIKRLGPNMGYSVAFTTGDKALVSSLSESLNTGVEVCYEGITGILDQIEARLNGLESEESGTPRPHNI
jgi:hypothetical protein